MRVSIINLLFSWLFIKPAYAASNDCNVKSSLAGECNAPSANNDQLLNTNNVDYLIVGAGGGGIQKQHCYFRSMGILYKYSRSNRPLEVFGHNIHASKSLYQLINELQMKHKS